LEYAAALRLPSSISKDTRKHIVDLTIEELGLKDAADTVIGGFGGLRKGISGGERRRVTIASILVSLPSIIILDEPTSGLDAFSAYQLLLTLSQLAKRNRTIVLSLHQPRSDAFALFTRILLLSKGDVVYSGLTSKCLPWFKELGEEPERGTNPLDFLIDISSVEISEDEKRDASRAKVQRLVQAWKERAAYAAKPKEQDVQVDRQQSETTGEQELPETTKLRRVYSGHGTGPELRRPGIIPQTSTLTGRCVRHERTLTRMQPHVLLFYSAFKNTFRNHGQTFGFAFQSIVIGLLLGVSFFRLGEVSTRLDISSQLLIVYRRHLPIYRASRPFAINMSVPAPGCEFLIDNRLQLPGYFYLTVVYAIYRYCETELVVFDRERADHLYVGPFVCSITLGTHPKQKVFPWLISEIVSNLPINVGFASLFATILYFMCNFRTDNLARHLFIFIAECSIVQLGATGFALIAASFVRACKSSWLVLVSDSGCR
jgi:ABC-type multidrug transport system ATPase subunit